MAPMTISAAAMAEIREALREAALAQPVIRLDQIPEVRSSLGLQSGVPSDEGGRDFQDTGVYEQRDVLVPLRWTLMCSVFDRREVPAECLVELAGVWFWFTPDWRRRLAGATLDVVEGALVLVGADGSAVLPVRPRR